MIGWGIDRDDSWALDVHMALYRRAFPLMVLTVGLGPWGTLSVSLWRRMEVPQ